MKLLNMKSGLTSTLILHTPLNTFIPKASCTRIFFLLTQALSAFLCTCQTFLEPLPFPFHGTFDTWFPYCLLCESLPGFSPLGSYKLALYIFQN